MLAPLLQGGKYKEHILGLRLSKDTQYNIRVGVNHVSKYSINNSFNKEETTVRMLVFIELKRR